MNLKDNDHRFSKADDSEASCKTPIPTASTDCTAVHEMRRGIQKSDIAITGISGRFADSANLEAFWSHLQQGHSCIKEIQPRKGWETYTHSGPDSEHAFIPPSKWGGMLYSIDQFDSLFFDISPHEATRIDPQQRLFLQEAYKAFEDAGYCAEQLSEKKVGVFVGARPGDYKDLLIDSTRPLSTQSEQMDAHLFLGNDMAILAARISYFLNCKGPSLTIDTASSSSLVAIHLACESIRTGESEMALAGGVFVMSSPAYYLMAAKTQLLAPDGKCKTFDKNANGIVIGEGVGALVLKPLEAAIADGDHLYGIIKGSAINQDGKTFGMTAPSLHSQKALLCDLYKKATINPATVTYLEAHGTGSKLGDPIEMQALNEAFHTFTDKKQFCAIGSHKPNIGHTVTCAGIAGVFKVLLAMKYQQIPPTLHVEETNPQIDFQNSPFFINTELREWKSSPDSPRRAGVSAFGLSGTNCHLILEEPSPQQKEVLRPTRPYLFFPFSAKTQIALMQKIVDMVKWLEKEDANYAVEDISYTLVQGRSHFAIRHAVVARNSGELKQCLSEIISNGYSELHVEKKERRDSQAESFLQPYGHWLLQELLENVSLDEEEYRKRLVALSALYVKGCNLNWERFFEKERYFRIPLPTYPFSGESYWIVEDRGGSLLKSYAGTPLDTADPGHDGGQEQTNTFLDDSGDKPQQFKVVLTDRLSKALSYMVSDLIKVSLEDIDIQTPLSEYGFDSITYIKFAHRLQQSYRLDLTPAHFFDYPTLECLAQYLHATYASVLTPYFATAYPVISQVATDEASRESSRIQQHACIECSQVPPTLTTALPIAIIGISGSFPQAPNVQSLWYNLLSGRDCISEIPPSRWSWQSYFGNPATEANKTNVKWAGIAEDVEWFDPLFFGISPGEAEQMDPPQRLLMTHIWKAIEDAGYAASSLSGTNTALFVGSTNSGYHERLSSVNMALEGYSATGQTPSVGPNRMSYLLNLHGPSEAIETACSSSLVAIHRGVSAIESGQCDMAIVGGVNTLISPALHISYSKAGMLCEDGRCKTFSAAANGYARGEGVGILVLKKLSDAERDADHIYGVIIGSAENHGGHASSLTAPNPRAQADLLLAAYRKAGIDPGTVGYIEAHGTGTPLGDPIEINGLKTAFSELAQMRGEGPLPQESCGLGSLKSYIGHLELAAGVAGVIKVLLQLQHKKLVKNLHCEQINPYIQLQDSPFYIVQQNREWEAPQDREGNISPRRAGVSSFGFGGANAHVVLEEYLPKPGATLAGSLTPQTGQGQTVPLLIVLSARNEERLYEQVQLLLGWMQAERSTENPPRLEDVAYTLQVGREAMEERLAMLVSSFTELEQKLNKYLLEPQTPGDWYQGQVRRHKETTTLLSADEQLQEAMQAAIGKWLQRGKYEKLLEWWVKGLSIDWQHLYGEERPRRISLPTYPFAHERYWVPAPPVGGGPAATPTSVVSLATLHPLIQHNTSTLRAQRFSSTFHGNEFFLADHVVKGQSIIPAAAYLEMARAAIAVACELAPQFQTGSATTEHKLICLYLNHVVWARPLIVSESPVTAHITLESQDNGTISFLVSEGRHALSLSEDKPRMLETTPTDEEAMALALVCQGRAELRTTTHREESQRLDLSSIQSRCQHLTVTASECYQRYHALGFNYGPSLQGITQLSVGDDELLARLHVPAVVAHTRTDFVLHPSLLDAALQSCIWLLAESNELQVPFALEKLEIVDEVPAQGWAWVRRREHSKQPGASSTPTSVFDLEVCDDTGRVVVHMRGLSTRALRSEGEEERQTVLLTPHWQQEVITLQGQAQSHHASQQAPQPMGAMPVERTGGQEQQTVISVEEEALQHRASTYFRKQLASLIKLPIQQIDAQAPLIDYGFDSIMAIRFTIVLEESFGPLSKTLLFEYSTLASLTGYFLQSYPEQLKKLLANFKGQSKATAITALSVTNQEHERSQVSSERQAGRSRQPPHRQRFLPREAQSERFGTAADIAIIGLAGRYPGARDLHAFWQNLCEGRDCITEIPPERWPHHLYYNPDKNKTGSTYCKWGGFLDGVDEFDPLFFQISPREAEMMDPQERLFLQCVIETLEDAGYTRSALAAGTGSCGKSYGDARAANVGVFVGVMYEEYQLWSAEAQRQGQPVAASGNPSWIANRVSYYCNLRGPSMAVDTMCSSSLTAMHLACQSIQQGDCELAIAGGVNVSIHPHKYLFLGRGRFLSSQGHCESFGQGADGYVPAEGVGAVLLKPLARAEADGDHIYGVIKATAINHGGKTNGLTVPNPQAQAAVIQQALSKAGIDASTISYIEAHGTGTVLGDPIEIAGLSRAFQAQGGTEHRQSCAIGSVKSNIGHAESAAGIAGLSKVLLQMQHGQLVPSIHADVLNPHIDFSQTPFVVQQELGEWERLQVASRGKEQWLPRRAGISAFGAGGANAHVIVEEYLPKHAQGQPEGSMLQSQPVLIVLSARTPEQLQQRVEQLLAWLRKHRQWASPRDAKLNLEDVAYTLQVGREPMQQRLALLVTSLPELEEKLQKYLVGQEQAAEYYQGEVKPYHPMGSFATDEDGQLAIAAWMSKGKYEKLLEWWVNGLTVDWELLYRGQRPRRISLPTYPFACERYWLPTPAMTVRTAHDCLHPLVQCNISDFFAQRFSSSFNGEEFFLADHVIKGQRLMPGVAYLEMAHAAIRQAMGSVEQKEERTLCLTQVVWLRSLVIGKQPVIVDIALELEEHEQIIFTISCKTHEPEHEAPAIMSQGRAQLRELSTSTHTQENQRLDLSSIQSRCQHLTVSGSECYQRYHALGFNYGPSLQGIAQLDVGDDELLARLHVPAVVAHTRTDFVLHPSLLDAALQSCIWLLAESNELQVPFALEELEIVDEVPAQGWAWVRRRQHSKQPGASPNFTSFFDLEVCDDTGRVVVRLRGLSMRALKSEEERWTVLLTPHWQPEEITWQRQVPQPVAETVSCTDQLVLLCDLPGIDGSSIQDQLSLDEHCWKVRVKHWQSGQPDRALRFQEAVQYLIQELQHLLVAQRASSVLIQIVVVRSKEPSLLEALAGVLKTTEQEYPKLQWQLLQVDREPQERELLTWLRENQIRPQERYILYRDSKRWIMQWQEVSIDKSSLPESRPWKEDGCYLITGGAGGLARLFVREMAQHVRKATVILVGRSPLSAAQRAQLESAVGETLHLDYQQVAVDDGPAVHALMQRVIQQYGHLDGIIHAAGVLRDSLLLNKTAEEVEAVLAPKVRGVEHLDEASKQFALDFFVLCSSISAVLGNVGQADYAAANAYLDAFAHARQIRVIAAERHGTTISINWPLWENGGMKIEVEERRLMQQQLGIEAMSTESGMKVLYQALALSLTQVMVAHGQMERIRQRLSSQSQLSSMQAVPVERTGGQEQQTVISIEKETLQYRTSTYFKKQLASLIKLAVQQIDTQAPLIDYGFDSVLAIRFINALEESFGPLSKTLLFECPTLESLTQYFLQSYPEQLSNLLANSKGQSKAAAITTLPVTNQEQQRSQVSSERQAGRSLQSPHRQRLLSRQAQSERVGAAADIAIIGLAGRYPGARDLRAFWKNLCEGRDCITEIPPERWPHHLYYNPDKNKMGSTYCKWGGFLDGVDEFDPFFFQISPREAEMMDPQERLFLQCVIETLEDAGYTRSALAAGIGSHGKPHADARAAHVGVFVGVMYGEYQLFGVEAQMQGRPVALGSTSSSIANHISYYCNLRGPSMAVDTMCSSSLTAMHLACQSIQQGDCELAIAGGVNVSIHPNKYLLLGQGKFVSSQGHCESFGQGADGYVPAEGVGAVLLKPLARAEADGDHIYGVIKATAINHGGKTNGLTVPNPHAQAEVIQQALSKAGIDASTISYIEAHGTGTVLGDPIEIAGLSRAFQAQGGTEHSQSCAIGSVKSNIGHAESAAGIAGLSKVLLQMQHGQLVPSIHADVLNPHIDFSQTPFMVQQQLGAWKRLQVPGRGEEQFLPRRAGISAFGAGGANAHVIVEEYLPKHAQHQAALPQPEDSIAQGRPALIVLSARTLEQLQQRVEQLLAWLREDRQWTDPHDAKLDLEDVAYTLQVGREPMQQRLALLVTSLPELEEKLQKYLVGQGQAAEYYQGEAKPYHPMGSFATDEDGQLAIAAWISKGKYEKLLEWWVNGLTVDWELLYRGQRPRRISLPTYPFARERYWFPSKLAPTVTTKAEPTDNKMSPSFSIDSVRPQRITLRPLADPPMPSSNSEVADQPQSSISEASLAVAQHPGVVSVQVLEEELANSLAQILYMEQTVIDRQKPFGEMGLDSVLGVEWIESLKEQFACHLAAPIVYEYPTIRQLAGFLQKELMKSGVVLQQTSVPARATVVQDVSLQPQLVQLSSQIQAPDGLPGAETREVVGFGGPGGEASLAGLGVSPSAPIPQKILGFCPGSTEGIAIVGMSGKYPGTRDLSEYWNNLVQGKNAIREIPLSRFDVTSYYDPNPAQRGKIYCKWLGAIDDIEAFDPSFFHLSPAEAEVMDPQHRLFLEEGYKAFADAGYSPALLSNRKCGVYLGIMSHEYALLLSQQKDAETGILGTSYAIAAARIAYLLNLKGPAIAIDTACSSSLVATHLACQALWQGEIDMALVGGVSLYLTPDSYVGMCRAGMLSPEGQCKAFDASANGFVPGEGVGAVVLKRLKEAEADQDQIHGVIIGSGMNQDGASNGMTAPNVQSQIELAREIYEKYRIDPTSISYVEMHGTGTKLGDPIELEALSTVFREKTQHKQYCAIGSVKSSIGHTSAAAGMAGLHKVLLAMKQQKLVPTLHFHQPNEHFDFSASPFYVNTQLQDWIVAEGTTRRAAVSSFGFSGTNAHLVVEEYIPKREVTRLASSTTLPNLFVLSAKSEAQLKIYAQELRDWVQVHAEQALTDVAFTLQVGREAMDYRLAILTDEREVLLQSLAAFINNQASTGVYTGQIKKCANVETEEDIQCLLDSCYQQRNLVQLVQLWMKGANIDWKHLYEGQSPRRVSLPAYPFARERYWLPGVSSSITPASSDQRLTADASLADQSNHQASLNGGKTPHDQAVGVQAGDVSIDHARRKSSYIQNLRNYRLPTFTPAPSVVPVSDNTDGLHNVVQDALKCIIAEILQIKREEIDHEVALLEYGFDLVTLTELINRLNQTYHLELTSAVLEGWYKAEMLTLQHLAYYLVQNDPDTLSKYRIGEDNAEGTASKTHA